MPQKKISKKKSLSRYKFLIAAFLILLCSFLLYQHYLNPNKQVATRGDNAKEWKTFTNTDYKYSFNYPARFAVSEKKTTEQAANYFGHTMQLTRYTYLFSTGTLINGQEDWSGFSILIFPTFDKTIAETFVGEGFGERIGTTPLQKNGNADEAAETLNIENARRVYRTGNTFFQVGTLQDANVLSDFSDFIGPYLDSIFNSITFQRQ